MARTKIVESRGDRMSVASDAGLGTLSLVSVLSGVLVAYGAFAVVAALAAGALRLVGVDSATIANNDWHSLGIGGGVAVALVLLLSYYFGGYVAGRMARRAGAVNGLFVFVFGILVAAGIGAAIGTQAGSTVIADNLRSLGVPTTASEWGAVGTVAGIGSLVAMLVGSLLGGVTGERWHGKLVTRAVEANQVEAVAEPVETLDEQRERERREQWVDAASPTEVDLRQADSEIEAPKDDEVRVYK